MAALLSAGDSIVDEYINTYRTVKVLHPSVTKLYETSELKRMFWDCLIYDLNLINRRSPNLAQFEITAAQKAFSALMRYEKDSVVAIELYVEEIIGLKFVEDSARNQALTATILMRDYMLNAEGSRSHKLAALERSGSELLVSPRNEVPACDTPLKKIPSTDIDRATDGLRSSGGSEGSRLLSSPCERLESARTGLTVGTDGDKDLKPNEDDPKLNRLLRMVYQANHEFRIAPMQSTDHTKAARFLRDTIENTLAYTTTKQHKGSSKKLITGFESSTLEYLYETLKQAKTVADEGSGGKKRRFEDPSFIESQPSARHPHTRNTLLQGHTTRTDAIQPHNHRASGTQGPRTSLSQSSSNGRSAQRDPIVSSSGHIQNKQAMHKRATSPFHRYPATIGQSVRRVFPRIEKPFTVRQQANDTRRGDRYRPSYR